MNFKTSVLAASVALILAGCGSDDSTPVTGGGTSNELVKKPNIAIPESGQFIDSKVDGLYYVQGSIDTGPGDLTVDGTYLVDTENPTITFILGGENGGLVLGSVSGRHVTTPYEAVGSQQRAVNLARLLLTIDDTEGEDVITIPQLIQTADADTVKELKKIQLDDILTIQAFVEYIGKTLKSEEEALRHFESEGSLNGLVRGSEVNLAHWSKGSNWTFVERSASQRISYSNGDQFQNVIHADRTLGEDIFREVTGFPSMTLKSSKDALILLKGSNDGSVMADVLAAYLTCKDEGGDASIVKSEANGFNVATCDGEETSYVSSKFDDLTQSNSAFTYNFSNPEAISTDDEVHPWGDMSEFGGVYACMSESACTEQSMTKYETIRRDDADEGQSPKWQTEILSGSYDPITDVYMQVRTKIEEANGYINESINFIYPVEKPGTDRYVDFRGDWLVTQTDVTSSEPTSETKTYTFNETGVIIDGLETPYEKLSKKDYWWFGSNAAGGISTATLDQLNTTIRWEDRDEGEEHGEIKINRFSYIPAGENWDRGILTRYTLNSNGEKIATETMQKISN